MSDNYETYYEEDEGIHFGPSDEELINEYLIPKLGGNNLHDDFIVDKNVYTKEPWLLDHHMDPFFKQNEWYYFVTRTKVSKDKTGCGKKAKRKIAGDNNDGIERGNWKANATEEINDSKTGKVIGKKQNLTYTRSNKNKKHKGGDGTCVVVPGSNDSWIMTEYMLPDGDKFQERVLCKIKRSKNKDEASSSSSSLPEQQPINEMNKSKEEDQLQTNAAPVSLGQESSVAVGLGEEPKDQKHYLGCRVEEVNDVRVSNEPSGEGSCVSLTESTLQISSEKDEQAKDIEVTHELKEDCIGGTVDKYAEKGLEDAPSESTKQWLKELENFLDDYSSQDTPFQSTQERVKELEKLLLTENGPGLLVEDDEEEVLIYNTPIMDQDLRDQCEALRHKRTSQTC